MTPSPSSFGYQEVEGVATITLNRPERLNALTFDVYAELRDLLAGLQARREVRAVIVTGAGRGFCSGGDVELIIGELQSRDPAGLLEFTRMTGAVVRNLRALRTPVVAALNGVAAGAGAVIALACDFRVASESASLAFLFARVGLAGADMGAAYLLPRVVGLARATELLMLGETVSADAACRMGLVNAVVPAEKLLDEAGRLARRLADGPAFALGMTKELLNQELDLDLTSSIEAEAQAQAICMRTRNFREAYEAFLEKRPARFE